MLVKAKLKRDVINHVSTGIISPKYCSLKAVPIVTK